MQTLSRRNPQYVLNYEETSQKIKNSHFLKDNLDKDIIDEYMTNINI